MQQKIVGLFCAFDKNIHSTFLCPQRNVEQRNSCPSLRSLIICNARIQNGQLAFAQTSPFFVAFSHNNYCSLRGGRGGGVNDMEFHLKRNIFQMRGVVLAALKDFCLK